MRIIPAIDMMDGKCVRLTQGDYVQKKIYSEDPLSIAQSFEEAGLEYLHLVDLDGARSGSVQNWDVAEKIASNTHLKIDFGGGIKKESDIVKLFDLGIQQVNVGSIAVRQPRIVYAWIKKFGAEKIILSADVKNELVQINGWQEETSFTMNDLVRNFQREGLQYVTVTDINTDGMLIGPNVPLYEKLGKSFPGIKVIASGGVSSLDDVRKLKKTGIDGVIIGKAIYENKISVQDLKNM